MTAHARPPRPGDDDYFIRLNELRTPPPPPSTADRSPGAGAREMQQRAAAESTPVDRFINDVTKRHSEERAWAKGAQGEERVAQLLRRRLPDGWYVLHDITIGKKGANLDHLVIGPGGIYCANTKNLTGNVTVYDRAILHNGKTTRYLPASRREAEIVTDRLSIASGWRVTVQPVIVIVGARLRIKQRPEGMWILSEQQLTHELRAARPVISDEAVVRLVRLARSPRTWAVTSLPPQQKPSEGSSIRLPPPDPRSVNKRLLPPPLDPIAATSWTVKHWRRGNHDRLYVNRGDGACAGWMDVQTGKLHDVNPAEEAVVRQVLLRHVRRTFT